jgi:hypothetical protein
LPRNICGLNARLVAADFRLWTSFRDAVNNLLLEKHLQLFYSTWRDAIMCGRQCADVRFWKEKGKGLMTQLDKQHGYSSAMPEARKALSRHQRYQINIRNRTNGSRTGPTGKARQRPHDDRLAGFDASYHEEEYVFSNDEGQ